MYKIAFCLPSHEMINLSLKIFNEHNRYEIDNGFARSNEFVCSSFLTLDFPDLTKCKIDADVVVSRGVSANELEKNEFGIPVIEIPILGSDLFYAIDKTRKEFGDLELGAIGSRNMIDEVEKAGSVLGIKAKGYYFEIYDEKKIHELIIEAKNDGCKIILGGNTTCKFAEQEGLKSLFLESSEKSIWHAIAEAKRTAKIKYVERRKSLQFKAIIENSHEGIIAVDQLESIVIVNEHAAKLLEINSIDAVGRKIDEVMPLSRLSHIIKERKTYQDEIVLHHKIRLSVNKVPLVYNDSIMGNVVTFQDITKIQETEGKIRNKVYLGGHVARYKFDDIIGNSVKITEVVNMAKLFAGVNSNILINGETGTGKELFVQSIHNASDRSKGPFVAINCAALPENLLESELFGYVEGAFTGASKNGKPGMFELAHNGTIFLDEISELPQKLQGRLLRVIQERSIMRLGHDKVIAVDVRLISATNKDLKALSSRGEFREDLYYRLNVMNLQLPPLREHLEDILPLVEKFTDFYAKEFKKDIPPLEAGLIESLKSYEWPGNIRELKNFCERLILFPDKPMIGLNMVGVEILHKDAEDKSSVGSIQNDPAEKKTYTEAESENLKSEVTDLEKQRICDALKTFYWNKGRVAKHLGISRTTLWRRIKEYGNIPLKENQ